MARADIDIRKLGATAAGLALMVACAIGAVWLLLRHWQVPPGGQPVGPAQVLAVPGPLLQSAPQDDLVRYRAEQQRRLDTAAWVDRSAGLVRIPIADALELVAAGQGVRPPSDGPSPPAAAPKGSVR
ncbi:MAG: hypothetical protein V4505_05835 [Pseudomonadota bacterium]